MSERKRVLVASAVGLVAAAATVTRAPGLVLRVFNRDETTIATVASAMSHGDELYTGIVDRKPPLVFWLYEATAAVTGTDDLRPVRLLVLLTVVATAIIIGREVHRTHPTVPAWVPALLLVLGVAAFPPEDAQAAGFEVVALLPASAAFVLARRGHAVTAGLTLGAAGLCKQPMLLAAPAIAIGVVRTRGWKAVVVTGAAALAMTLAPLLLFDAGEYTRWVFSGNESYLDIDALGSVLRRTGIALALLLTGQAGLLLATARGRMLRAPADLDAWVWLSSSVVASVLGWRFFGHYFLPVIPPLVVVAAPGLVELRWRKAAVAVAAFTAGVWVVLAWLPHLVNPGQEFDEPAARIAALTAPDERVLVWGQTSQLYWAADRLPSTRFPHLGFVTGLTGGRDGGVPYENAVPGAIDDLRADFAAHPPALIADSSDVLGGASYPVADGPIGEEVTDAYCVVDTVEDVDLWVPKGRAEAAGGCREPTVGTGST
jgi:hypothetical protein